MAQTVDLKVVVKHLVDGTLDENLCRICLLPFHEECENIFTKFSTVDSDYCVADVLEKVCNMQLSEEKQSSVCLNCFTMAISAYKFYLLSQRSTEILNFYVDELDKNVNLVMKPDTDHDSLCFTLPKVITETPCFSLGKLNLNKYCMDFNESLNKVDSKQMSLIKKSGHTIKTKSMLSKIKSDDEEKLVIVYMEETGERKIFKLQDDGLVEIVKEEKMRIPIEKSKEKIRRNRDPMVFTKCSKCPVKYRFIAKLKEHMKVEHNIDLFVCKLCKAIFENEEEFDTHFKTHTNTHRCAICNTVFKKRDTIIAHLKWHEDMTNLSQKDGAHVCELCGVLLPDEEQLKDHYDKKHDKKYTCFYCGRMYRGESSFEMHIKKHEMHAKIDKKPPTSETNDTADSKTKKKTKKSTKHMCWTCGKNFVDERALMWHNMLHTDERPHKCDICGRGFISVNRRNQHAVCAHSAPARRCPLCPALFHLRSMVNSHIKKVHLTSQKRRNRTSKHQNVYWRTETVPIQELSISIQNEILELKARNDQTRPADVMDETDFREQLIL